MKSALRFWRWGRQPLRRLPLWVAVLGLAALLGRVMAAGPGEGTAPFLPPDPIETGFYAIQGMAPEEARMVAEPLLSPQGKLGYLPSRNLLIIHDVKPRIEAIKKALAGADLPPMNIRIEVASLESGGRGERGLGVDDLQLRVAPGGKVRGSARLQGRDTRRTTAASGRQFITTVNGRPAQIWVGQSVPEPQWVFEYGCGRGWWRQDWVWQELGASLWVRPRVLGGNLVEVELYPRITFRGDRPRSIDVRELATTVVAAAGQPVPLGGLDESRREAYSRILGRGSVFNGSSFNLTLTVHLLPLPPPPPAGR
ncbi:MAG: hypothetical protein WC789_04430 [Lentisphaeria bacterium]|jgi:hypothetical protein